MKLSLFASVSAFTTTTTDQRVARDVEEKGEKRYKQLVDMMEHYNPQFDERKYWTYGCHCLILGDRPMSEMGHGHPVDPLDSVCKQYKECQKCARQKHGNTCIGEFVKYNYGETNGDKVCKNHDGTCERDLCMCDLAFAKAHVEVKNHFTNDYHLFYSTTGWEPEQDCVGGSGSADMQCCQANADDTPFVLYNANNKMCCYRNGEVLNLGDPTC